jgi:hypothetical protein
MIARSGLIHRQAVHVDGNVVLVQETWDTSARDVPFCAWPRGTPLVAQCQRVVPMSRSEAVKLGLIR